MKNSWECVQVAMAYPTKKLQFNVKAVSRVPLKLTVVRMLLATFSPFPCAVVTHSEKSLLA